MRPSFGATSEPCWSGAFVNHATKTAADRLMLVEVLFEESFFPLFAQGIFLNLLNRHSRYS